MTYEFECLECKAVTTVRWAMSRSDDRCPCAECGSSKTERLPSRFAIGAGQPGRPHPQLAQRYPLNRLINCGASHCRIGVRTNMDVFTKNLRLHDCETGVEINGGADVTLEGLHID